MIEPKNKKIERMLDGYAIIYTMDIVDDGGYVFTLTEKRVKPETISIEVRLPLNDLEVIKRDNLEKRYYDTLYERAAVLMEEKIGTRQYTNYRVEYKEQFDWTLAIFKAEVVEDGW